MGMIRYSPDLAREICDRLAKGESLRAICKDDHMPTDMAVRKWVLEDRDGFSSRYAQARDQGLDAMADQVIEIADEEPGTTDQGSTDTGRVAANRLRFDARRWYLSKLAPKRYGDRLNVEHSGAIALTDMSDDDIRAELAALSAMALAVPQNDSMAISECDEDDASDLV